MQAADANVADAIEIGIIEARTIDDGREERHRLAREPGQRDQRDDGGVDADVAVELRADAGQRVVQRQTIEIPRALVHQVGGERGEAVLARRVGGAAGRQQQRQAEHRHVAVLDRPDLKAAGRLVLRDRGKANRRIGTERRQPRAIDAHDTTACDEPGSASAVCPSGTTLSATRRSGVSVRAAARRCPSVSRR